MVDVKNADNKPDKLIGGDFYAYNRYTDADTVCGGDIFAEDHGQTADRRAAAVGAGGGDNDLGSGDGADGVGEYTAPVGARSGPDAYNR